MHEKSSIFGKSIRHLTEVLSLLKSIRNLTEVKETEIRGRGYARVWKTQLLSLVKTIEKLIFATVLTTIGSHLETVIAKKYSPFN